VLPGSEILHFDYRRPFEATAPAAKSLAYSVRVK